MTISIKDLNVRQLEELRARIDTRLPIARKEAVDRIRKLADDEGIKLADITKTRSKRKAKAKTIKPATTMTGRWRDGNGKIWSGRGRRPLGWDHDTAVIIA